MSRIEVPRPQYLCQILDEDVVYRMKNGKVEVGVVVESCENVSSDDEDEQPDPVLGVGFKRLQPGQAKVAWYPKGNTEVLAENKVKLVDRSLLPGDVIRRLPESDKDQRGFCKNSTALLSLRVLGTNKIIENVQSTELIQLSAVTNDVVIFFDKWVGYVHETKFAVGLVSPDGSKLIVTDDDMLDFEDILSERCNNSEFEDDVPYVGQHYLAHRKHLKRATWSHQTKEVKQWLESNSRQKSKIQLTVETVKVSTVDVKWLCCIASDAMKADKQAWDEKQAIKKPDTPQLLPEESVSTTCTVQPPSDLITGDAIDLIQELNYFKQCSLQIGDRGYYVIKSPSELKPYSTWKTSFGDRVRKQYKRHRGSNSVNGQENPEEAVGEDDDSDSQFIDVSDDGMSTDGESVAAKSASESTESRKGKRFGVSVRKVAKRTLKPASNKDHLLNLTANFAANTRVPVEVIATDTHAEVVWQSGVEEANVPSQGLYPIHHLDNHDFFPGDFVVENKEQTNITEYGVIQSVTHTARTAKIKWFKTVPKQSAPVLVREEDVSVYDIKDHPDFNYRPGCCVIRIPTDETSQDNPAGRAGQVISLYSTGQLMCHWADHSESLVWPQELYIIGEYDSDDLWGGSDGDEYDDDGESIDSWETESEMTLASEGVTPRHRKSTSAKSQAGDAIDTLRNAVTQLEEWFSQNKSVNYKNGLPVLQKILNVCRQLKNVDATFGTALIKLKELHTLVETTKPPPGSTGKMHVVANRLSRLLSSSSSANAQGDVSIDGLEMDGLEDNDVMDASTSTPTGNPSPANLNLCLELLGKLKTQLFTICSTTESLVSSSQAAATEEPAVKVEQVGCEALGGLPAAEDVTMADMTNTGVFEHMDNVPDAHRFKLSLLQPTNPRQFLNKVRSEIALLKSSLPGDIVVKGFEDRMDLLSVMIKGPKASPYEDGLFFFDIQLPATYPLVPPVVHYITYCNDRLNPNLYESGKVCVSLLGTWSGKGSEVWNPSASNLLQLLVSIQGLILVEEPYYNEAGYLKQRSTTAGNENSRLYNEMVVVKMVQSMTKMMLYPPEAFAKETQEHCKQIFDQFVKRHEKWIEVSEMWNSKCDSKESSTFEQEVSKLFPGLELPSFPLLPGSQGFVLSLKKALANFRQLAVAQ